METDEKGKIDYDNSFFGGILIRSLSKRTANDTSRVIGGPRKCLYELFNDIDVFNPHSNDFPKLVYNQKVDVNPELPVQRQIPSLDTKKESFKMDNQEYECLIKNYCYFVRANGFENLKKKDYSGTFPWNRKRI